MKLPILGIVTIVFLQLGFTAYNAMDRPLASLYTVQRVPTGSDPLAVLPDESDGALDSYAVVRSGLRDRSVNFSPADVRRRPRPAEKAVMFRNTVIRIPPARSLMPQLVAMQKPWDSAAIKQSQPMRSGGESENFPLPVDRSSEKRSFASKSASVLKKPYDWIKALGSKLN
jgi:hypothetical protein